MNGDTIIGRYRRIKLRCIVDYIGGVLQRWRLFRLGLSRGEESTKLANKTFAASVNVSDK